MTPRGPLLVTGFDAFANVERNVSGELAAAHDGRWLGGMSVVGRRLRVSWTSAWEELRTHIDSLHPAGILMLGVAYSPFVRLEVLAMNAAFPEADVEGAVPADLALRRIDPSAAAGYWSTLDLDHLERRLRDNDAIWAAPGTAGRVGVTRWAGAGSYLCNFVYFCALRDFSVQLPIAFVHIPSVEYFATKEPLFLESNLTEAVSSLVENVAQMIRAGERDGCAAR